MGKLAVFSDNARKLWELGYSVIPIHPKDKYPCNIRATAGGASYIPMNKWDIYGRRAPTDAELSSWETWDCNIGVTLGSQSGIVGLDLDNDVAGLHAKIEKIIPNSPIKKKGEKGYTAFYRYTGGLDATKWTWNKEGVRVAELLTNGQQTVLPPSLHPEGMYYKWETPDTLYDHPKTDLPILTDEILTEIDMLFRDRHETVKVAEKKIVAHYTKNIPERDAVMAALGYLDADDYDVWIHTGMSLKAEYDESGFGMWEAWSATSSKWGDGTKDGRATWDSFNREERAIGSLFYDALDQGYVAEYGNIETTNVEIIAGGNLLPTIKTELARHHEDIPEELLNAPGMIGRTMDHILATSLYPQPVLALAASICAVGTIMGHRCQAGSFGLRSNMYVMGLAPSGAGKDHARNAMKEIYKELGLQHHMIGVFKSSASVVKAVQRTEGRALCLWDEMGRYLKAICGEHAKAHEEGITTSLMHMYNHADAMFIGDEYADNQLHGGRADIDQPCLNVYATSTPQKLLDNMGQGDIEDGFLTRWLIFETSRIDLHGNMLRKKIPVPETLLAEYARWQREPTDVTMDTTNQGNIIGMHKRIIPKEVPFTDGAYQCISEYMTNCRRKMAEYQQKGDKVPPAVWARAGEHAIKLALVGHEHGEKIDLALVEWACALTTNRSEFLINAVSENMSENKHQRNVKKMFAYIEHAGDVGISATDIIRKSFNINPRERNDALRDLQMGGAIVSKKIRSKRGKDTLIYKDARL